MTQVTHRVADFPYLLRDINVWNGISFHRVLKTKWPPLELPRYF